MKSVYHSKKFWKVLPSILMTSINNMVRFVQSSYKKIILYENSVQSKYAFIFLKLNSKYRVKYEEK